MPQDLPGFYYDAEKNRYFPIKGPIPGSSSSSSSLGTAKKPLALSKPKQAAKTYRTTDIKSSKLLQVRELYGNVITTSKGKFNFVEEYRKMQASQPLIWKYDGTENISNGAMEQIHVDIERPDGAIGTEVLLTGGLNGSLCLYEVGKVGQEFDNGVKCMPDRIWPLSTDKHAGYPAYPGPLWRPAGASVQMPSNISSMKALKYTPCAIDDASFMQHVLITTLGSASSGGSVGILNLSEPLDYNPSDPVMRRRAHEITTFNCTVWTSDCKSSCSQVAIGTNTGAALVNIESGRLSWICRCKSDVLSLQLDHTTGNIVLCGLRNGAIVTVDARQKPEGSARLTRHQLSYPPREASQTKGRLGKQWFELKGNMWHSSVISMPSSISCLLQLQLYEHYFLASSMDGLVQLYDQRMFQRGALQSYEGNVNSHTHIQLGVDPSEKLLMSGGEDCYLRIWSIKSGELLFEDRFMDSVPSVICWPKTKAVQGETHGHSDNGQDPCLDAWLGSTEGIYSTCIGYG